MAFGDELVGGAVRGSFTGWVQHKKILTSPLNVAEDSMDVTRIVFAGTAGTAPKETLADALVPRGDKELFDA